MRRVVLVVIALALAQVSAQATPATPATDAARIERARGNAIDADLQAELPRYGSGTGSDHDPARGELRSGDEPYASPADRRRDDGGELGSLGSLGAILQILMWGLLVVGSVLVGFWLVNEFARDRDSDLTLDDDAPDPDPVDLAVIERPLGDAEDLAGRGAYAEAIHTLLLRTLVELVRSSAVRVGPAQTSREILARVPLLADAREALAGLITAVEVTHFGDDIATVDDYHRCRDQFQRFAAAFRGDGRARPA